LVHRSGGWFFVGVEKVRNEIGDTMAIKCRCRFILAFMTSNLTQVFDPVHSRKRGMSRRGAGQNSDRNSEMQRKKQYYV
jgi:hypothetical protein